MKKYTIRLNELQGQWLRSRAQAEGLKISDIVRSILKEQQRTRDFRIPKLPQKITCSEPEMQALRYAILSYQLLESLLSNEDTDSTRYNAAYAAAVERMVALKVHSKLLKSYCLTVWLTIEQSQYLEQEAAQCGKSPTQVLGGILVRAFEQSAEEEMPMIALHPAQQEGIRFSIMIYQLLEEYILSVYENGSQLIAAAKHTTEVLYAQLYSANRIPAIKGP